LIKKEVLMDARTKSQITEGDGKNHDNPHHAGRTAHKKREDAVEEQIREWQRNTGTWRTYFEVS
jgi:hypothetical protein